MLADANMQDLGQPLMEQGGADVLSETATATPTMTEVIDVEAIVSEQATQAVSGYPLWYWLVAVVVLVGLGYAIWYALKGRKPKRGRPRLP